MSAHVTGGTVLWTARGCVVAGLLFFLGTSFRTAWTLPATDFPNYYTAAEATVHRKPLRQYYDWSWFAREMNYAGVERQIGAYTPQTPLTMLPMIPLASLTPMGAKRVWLSVDLILLAATIMILASRTGIRWEFLAILLFCGYGSLRANAIDGQYYIFLLFLLTTAFYTLDRGHLAGSGLASGVAFGLKLYGGPLLLYFAARRRWKCVAGMLLASGALALLALALFGWSDIAYYLTRVLPRTLEGGSIDPYNPGVPSLSTLLRRLLMREPELNPNPVIDAPWMFFLARTVFQLGIVVFTVLGVAFRNSPGCKRDFAWFVVVLVLLSTSTAAYTFILLLAPVALLLDGASLLKSVYFAGSYVLLNVNIGIPWLFPKLWLLLLLFVVVGIEHWRSIPWRWAACAATGVLALSVTDARFHMRDYRQEPGRRYPQIAVERGALFAGFPAISQAGLFFQGMGDGRRGEDWYGLRWLHDGRIERLGFGGLVLHPAAVSPQGPILFELVANRTSKTIQFDPLTRTAVSIPARLEDVPETEIRSPDGRWVAYTKESATSQQIWLENSATGGRELLAGGACNNSSATWELDSSAIVFASDCGRAYGLPALYRAPVAPRASDPGGK